MVILKSELEGGHFEVLQLVLRSGFLPADGFMVLLHN